MKLPDTHRAVLNQMVRGEDIVMDRTSRDTRTYWRLTLQKVSIRSLRFLHKRELVQLTAKHSPDITIWGVSDKGRREAA